MRDLLERAIGRLANGTAEAFGIGADYTFTRRIPPVVNAAAPTAVAQAAAAACRRCTDKLLTTFAPSTAGDDFADFAAEAPGCYVWLGNGPATENALHHNTGYDFNDDAIPHGIRYWCEVVRGELGA